jgi:type IX secretion system PorP/SprF family membrane protein
MKKKFIGILFLVCVLRLSSFGQDIHFSQFSFTPLLVNPAQVGAYKMHQVILNYKSQWTTIQPDAYKTMMLSYDGRIMQKKWRTKWIGAGVTISNDKAGEGNMKTMQANAFVGYHVQLNSQNYLGAGLQGGFSQRSIDHTKLLWEQQTDPNINNLAIDNKYGYPDVGLGVLYQYRKGQVYSKDNNMMIIRVGLSISHLNRPTYSYLGSGEKLYAKFAGHVDALIGVKRTGFALMPGFLYMHEGPASEIFPGSYFRYTIGDPSKSNGKGTAIMIGTHFRVKDAFIPSMQFEYAEYTLGISYDMNISGFKSATSGKGGFEIALRYGIYPPTNKSSASFK